MSGENLHISSFCELELFEWVKFGNSAVSYPNDLEVFGKYMGTSIDIGPAMTIEILKSYGQYVHRLTYCSLTAGEFEDPKEKECHDAFEKQLELLIGPMTTKENFPSADEALEYYELHDEEGQQHAVAQDDDGLSQLLRVDG